MLPKNAVFFEEYSVMVHFQKSRKIAVARNSDYALLTDDYA